MKHKVRHRDLFVMVLLVALLMVVCGNSSLHAQSVVEQQKTIVMGKLERTYSVHLPPDVEDRQARALVIVLHGGGGSGADMDKLTHFNELSDREHFVVVYPDGMGHHWNDGRREIMMDAQCENVDDVDFIAALIDTCIHDYQIDSRRVYVTGMSNGAMMAYRLACELSAKVTAIAPVAGSMPITLEQKWPPRPVPVLAINGTDDPIVPFDGGTVRVVSWNAGKVMSVYNSIKFWVTNNYCSLNPETVVVGSNVLEDDTRAVRSHYWPADTWADVVLYKIEGGGHTWPGGWQYANEPLIGKTSRQIDATAVIWDFFKKHIRY